MSRYLFDYLNATINHYTDIDNFGSDKSGSNLCYILENFIWTAYFYVNYAVLKKKYYYYSSLDFIVIIMTFHQIGVQTIKNTIKI